MAVTVDRWSGRYARALREAKRMSVREFATHLGVTDATVSNWERRRDQTRLRYETQQLLDTCLARSTPEQQARFERLLAASPDRPHGPPGDPHGGGADRGARVGGALPVAVESVAACDPTAALARVLTGHVPSVRPEVAPSLAALETAVTHAKRDYQAGRYGDALHPLPDVIRLAEVTTAGVDGDTRPQAFGLAASAYQVACSLLIKHGDVAVAMLAADECVAAALAGGDPVAVAASARAMTHALLASGHHRVAAEYGEAAAGRLDRAGGSGGPTGLSVRGRCCCGLRTPPRRVATVGGR